MAFTSFLVLLLCHPLLRLISRARSVFKERLTVGLFIFFPSFSFTLLVLFGVMTWIKEPFGSIAANAAHFSPRIYFQLFNWMVTCCSLGGEVLHTLCGTSEHSI